jgi:hypothetical protein
MFFFESFGFSLSLSFHRCPISIPVSSGGWAIGLLAAQLHRNVVSPNHRSNNSSNNKPKGYIANIRPTVMVFGNCVGGTARRFRCALLLLLLPHLIVLVAQPPNILTVYEQYKCWNFSFCSPSVVTASKVNSYGLNGLGLILGRTFSASPRLHWRLPSFLASAYWPSAGADIKRVWNFIPHIRLRSG